MLGAARAAGLAPRLSVVSRHRPSDSRAEGEGMRPGAAPGGQLPRGRGWSLPWVGKGTRRGQRKVPEGRARASREEGGLWEAELG